MAATCRNLLLSTNAFLSVLAVQLYWPARSSRLTSVKSRNSRGGRIAW